MGNIPIAWAPSTMLRILLALRERAQLGHRHHAAIRVLDVTEAHYPRSRRDRGVECCHDLFRTRHGMRQLICTSFTPRRLAASSHGRDTRRMLMHGGENFVVRREVDTGRHAVERFSSAGHQRDRLDIGPQKLADGVRSWRTESLPHCSRRKRSRSRLRPRAGDTPRSARYAGSARRRLCPTRRRRNRAPAAAAPAPKARARRSGCGPCALALKRPAPRRRPQVSHKIASIQ